MHLTLEAVNRVLELRHQLLMSICGVLVADVGLSEESLKDGVHVAGVTQVLKTRIPRTKYRNKSLPILNNFRKS